MTSHKTLDYLNRQVLSFFIFIIILLYKVKNNYWQCSYDLYTILIWFFYNI